VKPDLPAAPIRLAGSGLLRALKNDVIGGMLFLRHRRRAAAARRAMEELAAAAAWTPPVVVAAPVKTNRHELGSAARTAREARGWARLDRS
jgi:hypothetical protein